MGCPDKPGLRLYSKNLIRVMPAEGVLKEFFLPHWLVLTNNFLKMKKCFFGLLLQMFIFAAFGQIKLSGVVLGNNEPLAGASVVLSKTMYGVSTLSDGTFEFKNLKPGDYLMKVSFIGFETIEIKVSLKSNQSISVKLKDRKSVV